MRKSSARCTKSQPKDTKSEPKGAKREPKVSQIRRPSACQNPYEGEVYLPPTPSALGSLAAKVGPESSIRTLYVYWGLTLVRMDQILRRGASVNFGPLVAHLRFKRIGSILWPRLGLSARGGFFPHTCKGFVAR